MTDYKKLTPNTIKYLCRRYGHKHINGDNNVVCARCGIFIRDFNSTDLLLKYIEKVLRDRLDNMSFWARPLPIVSPNGTKLIFKSWTPISKCPKN